MRGETISNLLLATAIAISTISRKTNAQCLTESDDLTTLPTYHDISGMVTFDLNLFKEIYFHTVQHKNVFMSPYSIWSSLLLAYFGSAGKTQAQMEQVLGINDKITVLKTWRVLEFMYRDRLGRGHEDTFVLANRVFIQPKIILNPCFENILYDEVERIDLTKHFEASQRINQYLFDRTSGKISNLVQPNNLERAVSVLANAAAFKGTWHEKFNPNDTTPEKFYSSPEDYAIVPMMSQTSFFHYGKSLDLQAEVLELPYSDGYTSMFLLLPAMTTGPDLGLADLVSRLTPHKLRSAFINMGHREVKVKLPKFKLNSVLKNELKEALYRMGMKDLFTNMANLTALAPFGGLKVSESLHQANVEVDEKGTEASAATIFVMASRTRTPPPATFECNRPFLFVIYDNFTGNLLFLGSFRNAKI